MPAERSPGGPTPRFVYRPLLFIREETPKIGDVAQ
jgi:hypothetical protein